MEWIKEGSQFLVDWNFSKFRSLRGLFYINALEHYTGYTIDMDKLHKSLIDQIWAAVRHFFMAGQDVFLPLDRVGMRDVPLQNNEPQMAQMTRAEVESHAALHGLRLDVQGDTEPKFKKRVQPTFDLITQVILDLDERSHELSRNYRMAMSELEQKVSTARCEVKYSRTGSLHIPIFSAEVLFLVDCRVYNEQTGAASSERKADAFEDAAKQLFIKLVKIAEDNRKTSDYISSRSQLGWEYGHIPNLYWKEEERLDSEQGKFVFVGMFEGRANAEDLGRFYEEMEQPTIPMISHFQNDDWFADVIRQMGYYMEVDVSSSPDNGMGLRKTTIVLGSYPLGSMVKDPIKVNLYSNKRVYPDVGVDFSFGETVEIAIRSAILEMFARENFKWANFRGEGLVRGDKN